MQQLRWGLAKVAPQRACHMGLIRITSLQSDFHQRNPFFDQVGGLPRTLNLLHDVQRHACAVQKVPPDGALGNTCPLAIQYAMHDRVPF